MDESNEWLRVPAAQPHAGIRARMRRGAGDEATSCALGRLEEIPIELAALQGTERPRLDRVGILVFAADPAPSPGEGRPEADTARRVCEIAEGRAAVGLLAREIGAHLEVVNLGTGTDPGPLGGVLDLQIRPGSADPCRRAAMTRHQLACAMHAGRHAAERARLRDTQLFIGGAVGSAGAGSRAALACALLASSRDRLSALAAGPMASRLGAAQAALELHRAHLDRPLEALRRLGGYELAALTGGFLACAHMGIPVLVDGFATAVAALAAVRLCPGARPWLLFSHCAPETDHRSVLGAMGSGPILDLGVRSEDGGGAAALVPLLRLACARYGAAAVQT